MDIQTSLSIGKMLNDAAFAFVGATVATAVADKLIDEAEAAWSVEQETARSRKRLKLAMARRGTL